MCGFCVLFTREKAKSKEREEAWIKIENLAKSNPQVSCVCVCVFCGPVLVLDRSFLVSVSFFSNFLN